MQSSGAVRFSVGLRRNRAELASDVRDAIRAEALEEFRRTRAADTLLRVVLETDRVAPEPEPEPYDDAVPWVTSSNPWHVCVPVRGAHRELEDCLSQLATLRRFGAAFDVSLVCPDAEYADVEEIADRALFAQGIEHRVLGTVTPKGFAEASNLCVQPTWRDTDSVLFLNSDALPASLGSISGAFDSALELADAAGPWGTNVSGFQAWAAGAAADLSLIHI